MGIDARPTPSSASGTTVVVYDADSRDRAFGSRWKDVWHRRRLMLLLARRDLLLRYKRSILGVWWTLLNPLLEMVVLWVVFSQAFRFDTAGVPYVVYLLTGIVMVNLFRGIVTAVAAAMVDSAGILTRLRVPAEVFCAAAGLQVYVTFVLSVVPLTAIMVLSGARIPASFPMLIVPSALLAVFAFGVGLIIAPVAVRFPDSMILTGVILTFLTYLTPVFYPVDVVPEGYRWVIDANPVFHYLQLFRDVVYEGTLGSASDYLWLGSGSLAMLALGGIIFGVSHRAALAAL